MVDQLSSFAAEVTRVAREVGTEGKLGGQADVKGVAGTWKDLTDNVNFMASNLTGQVRNIADVTTAVANGDLSKKITVDVRGEILELKNTINTMVDQLGSFASEVTRVAREVGTEGKLGGQAVVRGVGGTWKDLTDNVNFMANNLTNQVRGIAQVVTDVATGNLKRKLVLDAKGEIEQLAETINGMIDTLATFADQVTTVAREVGIEGKLGGQASVPGAAGTWRDLTDYVNRLAANLTTQVRAIADVATAVTKGDLSQSVAVDAAGEVAALKDNINEMIRNLKDTTQKNTEQDWLKTNLAKFTRLLQGQRDLLTVSRTILSELAPLVSVQHGVFYMNEASNGQPEMTLLASYAYTERKNLANHFKAGEGLVGQCALEKTSIVLSNVPADYVQVRSGLGEATPLNIVVLPVLFEGEVKAVIELASFYRFSDVHLIFLNQLTESIGIVLNTIVATMRTEELLKQSQSLAVELQTRQRELTETNTAARAAGADAATVRGTPQAAAGRIATDQRGARGEGGTALEAESGGREEEPGNRTGPDVDRREGGAAGADLEIQVRVPRQHVARAPHAAEQPAHSVEAPLAEYRGQPHRQADRVRAHDLLVRLGPARADQRDSRPLEDRVRDDGRRCAGGPARPAAGLRRAHVQADVAVDKGLAFEVGRRAASRAVDRNRREAAAAGAEKPALERAEVHREGQRPSVDRSGDVGMEPRSGSVEPCGTCRRVPCRRLRASASPPTSTGSFSKPSSRPTARPADASAEPASGCRSAGRLPSCSAARSGWPASRATAARSPPVLPGAARRSASTRARGTAAPRGSGRAGQAGARARRRARGRRPAARPRRRASCRTGGTAAAPAPGRRRRAGRAIRCRAPRTVRTTRRDGPEPGDRTSSSSSRATLNFAKILLDAGARRRASRASSPAARRSGLALARTLEPDAITLDIDTARARRLERCSIDSSTIQTRHIPVHIISVTRERAASGLKSGRSRSPRSR